MAIRRGAMIRASASARSRPRKQGHFGGISRHDTAPANRLVHRPGKPLEHVQRVARGQLLDALGVHVLAAAAADEARALLQQIVAEGRPDAFGTIAAEADLARGE